jgi:hypothetical protein
MEGRCLAIFVFHIMLIVMHKGKRQNEKIVLNKRGLGLHKPVYLYKREVPDNGTARLNA